MEWYYIVIGILFILVITGVFGIVNLLKKVEMAEDTVMKQVAYLRSISYIIKDSRDNLEKLDEKGAFQSDDEVGRFFQSLKLVQSTLDAFILPEDYGKKKKKE